MQSKIKYCIQMFQGCITKLYKHLESYVPIIIAILVIIGILQLLGLILALILCCAVSFVNRYKA